MLANKVLFGIPPHDGNLGMVLHREQIIGETRALQRAKEIINERLLSLKSKLGENPNPADNIEPEL